MNTHVASSNSYSKFQPNGVSIRSLRSNTTTDIFWSQDVLLPFLLVHNYLVMRYMFTSTGIDAIQHLIEGGLVQLSDGVYTVSDQWIQVEF